MSPRDLSAGSVKNRLEELRLLLCQKEQEYDQLRSRMTQLQATLQSERVIWEQQRKLEEQTLRLQRQSFEEEMGRQQNGLEQKLREATEALQRVTAQEWDLRSRLMDVTRREQQVLDLNRERLDIGLLRRQAETQMFDVQQQWSVAQTKVNDASDLWIKASKTLAECEQRNQAMNEEWNKLTKWQEDLTLKQKDLAILNQTINAKLDALHLTEAVHAHP